MSGEPSSRVDIVVRCAFQTVQDIRVDCLLEWTIKDLKEHLHDVCAIHPTVTSQRLIYAGACLTDEIIIRSVLERKHFEGEPVFHLVCPLPQSSPELRHRDIGGTANPATTANAGNGSRGNAQEWLNTNVSRNSSYANLASSQQMPTDYVQAYQAYYGWYMNNYAQIMAYYQTASTPGISVGPPSAFPVFNTGLGGQPQIINEQGPQPRANLAQDDPDAGLRAGGDYLDMMYRAFRIVLFLSVVFFYSTVERFLIVISIALFIFFIQLRRGQRRAAEAAAPQHVHVNNNNNGEEGNGEQRQGGMVIEGELTGIQVFFSTCYSFVTSFFTSLVPENPVPVNLN